MRDRSSCTFWRMNFYTEEHMLWMIVASQTILGLFHCGTMLQFLPLLFTPTIQSSIWWRALALTRAQVEEILEAGSYWGKGRMTAFSWHPSLESQLPSPPCTPHLPSPLHCHCPTGLGGPVEGNKAQPAPPGHYQPHTCCLLSCLLSSCARTRVCLSV